MKSVLETRRLIPKWVPSTKTVKTYEARDLKSKLIKPLEYKSDPNELDQLIYQWHREKTPGLLGDILSFSVYSQFNEQIFRVIEEISKSNIKITNAQKFFIENFKKFKEEESISNTSIAIEEKPFQKNINNLRAILRTNPEDAIALLDYAQLQAAVGKTKSAEQALLTAKNLHPQNRNIIRILSRFYVHIGYFEKAYYLIKNHPATKYDPWLLSSEIALADLNEKISQNIAKAKRFIQENKKSITQHHSELAGNIAMQELLSGRLKNAREFQRIALLHPTENVVAQAVDKEDYFGISLDSKDIQDAISKSSEANVLRAWYNSPIEEIKNHTLNWHNEEPFSSRPIHLLSTVFSLEGSFDDALSWTHAGLISNPDDRGLLINLSYIYARQGNENKAYEYIKKTQKIHGEYVTPYLMATEGLIFYKRGDFSTGDILYNKSKEIFDNLKNRSLNLSTFCSLNQLIIAEEVNHPNKEEINKDTLIRMKERPNADAIMISNSFKIEKNEKFKDLKNKEKRIISQWIFNKEENTLTQESKVFSENAKPFLIK